MGHHRVFTQLVETAGNFDPDVQALLLSQSEAQIESGQGWRGWRHVVGFLHDHANQEMLRLKAHERQVVVLCKCKAVAALIAATMHKIEPALDAWSGPLTAEAVAAWKRQAAGLFDALTGALGDVTFRWYRDNAADRAAWRRLPPFLSE